MKIHIENPKDSTKTICGIRGASRVLPETAEIADCKRCHMFLYAHAHYHVGNRVYPDARRARNENEKRACYMLH